MMESIINHGTQEIILARMFESPIRCPVGQPTDPLDESVLDGMWDDVKHFFHPIGPLQRMKIAAPRPAVVASTDPTEEQLAVAAEAKRASELRLVEHARLVAEQELAAAAKAKADAEEAAAVAEAKAKADAEIKAREDAEIARLEAENAAKARELEEAASRQPPPPDPDPATLGEKGPPVEEKKADEVATTKPGRRR